MGKDWQNIGMTPSYSADSRAIYNKVSEATCSSTNPFHCKWIGWLIFTCPEAEIGAKKVRTIKKKQWNQSYYPQHEFMQLLNNHIIIKFITNQSRLTLKGTKIQQFYCRVQVSTTKMFFFQKMTSDSKKVHKFAWFFWKFCLVHTINASQASY